MIKATEKNFDRISKSDQLVVMDFFATWCGPCKMLVGAIAEVEKNYKRKATFASIDIDEENELVHRFNIRSVPTLMVFKDGELIWRNSGALSAAELSAKIDGFLESRTII